MVEANESSMAKQEAQKVTQQGVNDRGKLWKEYIDEHEASEDFKKQLSRELDEGCHFVPLIGQGLSERAGVLTPQHHFPYLVYTIWRCVAAKSHLRNFGETRWKLREDGFPPEPPAGNIDSTTGYAIRPALMWLNDVFEKLIVNPTAPNRKKIAAADDNLLKALAKLANTEPPRTPSSDMPPDPSADFRDWNRWGNWLAALNLLCCLHHDASAKKRAIKRNYGTTLIDPSVTLGEWKRNAMDAFNIFASRGVRPGLAHQMLASLARPFSVHTILSTNPDTLIEQAFDRIHTPLRAFDVRGAGMDGIALPSVHQVRAQDSIVKINFRFSSGFGFEAESPTPEDCGQFFQYLFPGFPDSIVEDEKNRRNFYTPPGRLLVLGFQPQFQRSLGLIHHVLETVAQAREILGNDPEIEPIFGLVKVIREQLDAFQGNVFKVERRVSADFMREAKRLIGNVRPNDKRKRLREHGDNFEGLFHKTESDLGKLTDLVCDNGEHYVSLRDSLETLCEALDNEVDEKDLSRFRSYNMKDLTSVTKTGHYADFFGTYIWPAVLANAFISAMGILRRERLVCPWSVANFKVFWVCEEKDDPDLLREYFKKKGIAAETFNEVFCFTYTRRPDILLYQLYQEATLCLPPGGMNYQFIHMVAPDPPMLEESLIEPSFNECVRNMLEALHSAPNPGGRVWKDDNQSFLIVENKASEHDSEDKGRILTAFGGRGLSSVVSLALREVSMEHIWIELADHATPEGVFHDVLATIAQRTGRLQQEYVSLAFDEGTPGFDGETAKLLRNRLCMGSRSWLIVFYARSLPGANGRWNECSSWGEGDYLTFQKVMKRFQLMGATVLYLPLRASRAKQLPNRIGANKLPQGNPTPIHDPPDQPKDYTPWSAIHDKTVREEANEVLSPDHSLQLDDTTVWEPLQQMKSVEIFKNLREWVEKGKSLGQKGADSGDSIRDRLKFLHVLTLFRHSRHLSALCSEATYPCKRPFQHFLGDDNDIARSVYVRKWLDELYAEVGLLRRKNGGFSWMHWSLRIYLQRALEAGIFPDGSDLADLFELSPEQRKNEKVHLPEEWLGKKCRRIMGWKSRSHHWIADWYFRGFLASRHPLPLQECLHHHFEAVRHAPMAELPTVIKQDPEMLRNANENDALVGYKARLVRISLVGIATTIKLALPTLQFWLDEDVGGIFRFGTDRDPNATNRTESLPELTKLLQESIHEIQPDLYQLWPLYHYSEAHMLASELVHLLNASDSAPVCELIQRQCKTIHQILLDERGKRIFYGREPDDEVPARLQRPRPSEELQHIYHETVVSSASVKEDLEQINALMRDELGLNDEQAESFTEFPEVLEEKFRKQHPNKTLKDLARCDIHLGHWLARLSETEQPEDVNSFDEIVKNSRTTLDELVEDLAKLRNEQELHEDDGSFPPLRQKLRDLTHKLTDALVLADNLPIRRRGEIREMLKLVESCAHLQARRANILESMLHSKARKRGKGTAETRLKLHNLEQKVNKSWAHVCRLCTSSMALTKYLLPAQSDIQIRETIAIRSLYAQALGRLRRFTEAHRRLDEAFAYLLNSRYAVLDAHWGVLALRRADVYLHEALDGQPTARGTEGTMRRRLAKLNDAWAMAELAEWWLGGNNRNNWWWGRLHLLKLKIMEAVDELRVEAEKGRRGAKPGKLLPLTNRTRIDTFKQVREIFEQVCLMVPNNELRMARALESISRICAPQLKREVGRELLKDCLVLFRKHIPKEAPQFRSEELVNYLESVRLEIVDTGRKIKIDDANFEHRLDLLAENRIEFVPSQDSAPGDVRYDPSNQATFVSFCEEEADFVRDLCKAARDNGINPVQYLEAVKHGDSIKAFEGKLGKAGILFAVVNDRYLKSNHCFVRELWQVYNGRCDKNDGEFREKVIPLIVGKKAEKWIDDPSTREPLREHWRKIMDSSGVSSISTELRTMFDNNGEHFEKLLDALADITVPRGHNAIRKDDFRAVLDIAKQRLENLSPDESSLKAS